IVAVPAALGVNVTEQLPLTSVQLVALNVPAGPVAVKATDPAGVLLPAPLVSTTVAVQVEAWLMATVPGLQTIVVEVVRRVAVTSSTARTACVSSIARSVSTADSRGPGSARSECYRTAATHQRATCGAEGSCETRSGEGYRACGSCSTSTVSVSDSCGTGRRLVNRDSARTTDNRCRGGPTCYRYRTVASTTARTSRMNSVAGSISSANRCSPRGTGSKCHRATSTNKSAACRAEASSDTCSGESYR